MPPAVKRGYRSDLRAAQARATRRAVVAAATELFIEQGYGATTVEAVAQSAGVSRKTVFTAVGGKPELLKTALNWAVAGDDKPLALADRAAMRRALEQTDPTALIGEWVGILVDIDTRVGPLLRVLEVAAGIDQDARRLADHIDGERLTGARTIVSRLTAMNALTPGITRGDATDIAWLATDPMLHDRLVGSRGWSLSRFQKWLTEALCHQLLGG
jgi:AcrR family transcriptional regulator